MKTRIRVEGVIIETDDGDPNTADITEVCGEELTAEANEQRLLFLKRHVASYGYKIVDKDGNEV